MERNNNQEDRMARMFALMWGLIICLAAILEPACVYSGDQEPSARLFDGKSLSDWIAATMDHNPQVQKRATEVLDAVIIPKLTEETTSRDYSTRYDALSDLGRIGSRAKSAVTAITHALKDEEPVLRVIAASALKKIDPQTKGALPVLAAVLRVKDDTARCFAAGAFAQFGEEAVQPILEVLADLDPYGQSWAVGSLAIIGKPALPRLIKALEDKNPLIRSNSAAAIARMEITEEEAQEAIPGLRRLLSDAESSVAAEAATALRRWQK
jgi:HEAT repeat protein